MRRLGFRPREAVSFPGFEIVPRVGAATAMVLANIQPTIGAIGHLEILPLWAQRQGGRWGSLGLLEE